MPWRLVETTRQREKTEIEDREKRQRDKTERKDRERRQREDSYTHTNTSQHSHTPAHQHTRASACRRGRKRRDLARPRKRER